MEKYISHWSAAKYWKIAYAESVFEKEFNENSEMQYTLFHARQIYCLNGEKHYYCSVPIPASLRCIDNGIAVVSPDLMLMQVARTLDFQRLVLFAMLMCGEQPKKGIPALTTKEKLVRNIKKSKGVVGRRKALRALQYVENECQSPMEAFLYMFLSLPYSQGGLGFPKGVFNQKITLTKENVILIEKESVRADIAYPPTDIIVEYNSNLHHSDPDKRRKDSERVAALERQGYRVFSISTDQFYSPYHFGKWVQFLAAAFRKRIRIPNDKQRLMNMRMREYLPRAKDADDFASYGP